MNKLVFVFPGVGSHHVGMGKKFYDEYDIVRQTFEEAGDVLHMDMAKLCFDASQKKVLDTLEHSQTALVTLSTAMYRVYRQEIGVLPHYFTGHSLGEYSALCCAGVIQFQDALQLVLQRGLIIKEVSASLDGTMMWVINLDTSFVDQECRKLAKEGETVYVSAFDSPTQSSISGSNESVMKAAKMMEKAGAIVYPLKMSGPFHSPLMKEAAARMKSLLNTFTYNEPERPVMANCTAQPYSCASEVTQLLSQQLVSPIRWQPSLTYLQEQGVTAALEIGPKEVLTFLIRKNTPHIRSLAMAKDQDLKSFKEEVVLGKEEYLDAIGRCLGAAVSTKNHNFDNDQYSNQVITPYRQLESLYQSSGTADTPLTDDSLQQSIGLLETILEGKQVPSPQRQDCYQQVLNGKIANIQINIQQK